MKKITAYIDNKYGQMEDKDKAVKSLFILGYDLSQVQFITGVDCRDFMKKITFEDVVKRCEKMGDDDLSLDFYYKITGLKFTR